MTLLGVSQPLLSRWRLLGLPSKRWKQCLALLALRGYSGITIDTMANVKPSRQASPEQVVKTATDTAAPRRRKAA